MALEHTKTERGLNTWLRRLPVLAAAVGVGVGALVLLGWAVDNELLKRAWPSLPSMKANTAVAVAAAGAALWVLDRRRGAGRLGRVGVTLAAVTLLIGLATLIEYALGRDLGIDQLLFRDTDSTDLWPPGRMAPASALALALTGGALLLLGTQFRQRFHLAQTAALATALLAMIALMGYLYEVQSLTGIGHPVPMALPGAVTFLLLGLGTLGLYPDQGYMADLTGPGPGSRVARRWLPIIVGLPILVAGAQLAVLRLGWVEAEVGLARGAIFSMATLGALAWIAARSLNRSGQRQQAAEEALRRANEDLEARVAERTAQLAESQVREIAELRAAEQRVQAFATLAQQLNTVTTPREAAEIVLAEADRLLGWDCAYLDLFSAEQDRQHPILNYDVVNGRRTEVPPVAGDEQPGPMTRRLLTEGGQLILRTADEMAEFGQGPRAPDADNLRLFGDTSRRSASLIYVPVRHGPRSTGILSIQSYTLNAYTTDSLNTLQALADHAAGALDRIRTQTELQGSEARIRAINDASPIGILVTDQAGGCVYTNQVYQRIAGLSQEAALGQGWTTTIHPEDRERVFTEWGAALAAGHPFETSVRYSHPDGAIVWAHVQASAIRDGTAVLGYVNTVEDITERRLAEAALRESEARYRYIVDNANDLIYEADVRGHVTAYNPTALRLLKYGPTELLGRRYLDFVHPDQRREVARFYGRQFLHRVPTTYKEILILDREGEALWLGQQAQLVVEGDTLLGFQVVARDITERKRAERALQAANEQLTGWVDQLEHHNRAIGLLSHMGGLLQACQTLDEAYAVFDEMLGRLFPATTGALYVLNASRNLLEAAARWGDTAGLAPMFAPDECWALRRGRQHQTRGSEPAIACRHALEAAEQAQLCVPMMALGDTLGLLHVRTASQDGLPEADRQLVVTVAEQAAMALSNLRLRDSLRYQSIRDPLTTLYNRRYMEESLERELQRASRSQQPLGVIMLDLDHYKQFNDTFGHAAGDTVLRELGAFLRGQLRGGDIACRYGGEEFTLILPECSLENAVARAEQIRQGVRHLDVQYHGQALGTLTMSAGVAGFPVHGNTMEALIQAADKALYRAKHDGRDRVAAEAD